MKNVRLITTKGGFEVLKAFLEENYLGNYIANNENELFYIDITNFPDVLENLENDTILFSKNDITQDDEFVWLETMQDMQRKNATYYSIIINTEDKSIEEFMNESGKIVIPILKLDSSERIENIENLVNERMLEEDLEM